MKITRLLAKIPPAQLAARKPAKRRAKLPAKIPINHPCVIHALSHSQGVMKQTLTVLLF